MLPPQPDSEVRPIVAELQAIDPLLDIIWNPQAKMLSKGSYSELGKLVPPTYDARWQVIRYDSPEQGHAGVHPERGYTVITDICEYVEYDGILCIVSDGAYAPVDQRILRLMRSADAWQVDRHREIQQKLWRQNDAVEARDGALDEAAAIDALDHNHFVANYRGGVGNWQGCRVDLKGMEAAATKRAVQRILSPR